MDSFIQSYTLVHCQIYWGWMGIMIRIQTTRISWDFWGLLNGANRIYPVDMMVGLYNGDLMDINCRGLQPTDLRWFQSGPADESPPHFGRWRNRTSTPRFRKLFGEWSGTQSQLVRKFVHCASYNIGVLIFIFMYIFSGNGWLVAIFECWASSWGGSFSMAFPPKIIDRWATPDEPTRSFTFLSEPPSDPSQERPFTLAAVEVSTLMMLEVFYGHSAADLRKTWPECAWKVHMELWHWKVRKLNWSHTLLLEFYNLL